MLLTVIRIHEKQTVAIRSPAHHQQPHSACVHICPHLWTCKSCRTVSERRCSLRLDHPACICLHCRIHPAVFRFRSDCRPYAICLKCRHVRLSEGRNVRTNNITTKFVAFQVILRSGGRKRKMQANANIACISVFGLLWMETVLCLHRDHRRLPRYGSCPGFMPSKPSSSSSF